MVTSHQRSERSSGATATPSCPEPARLDEAVSMGASRVAAALAEPSGARTRDEWLGVVGDCQSLINTLSAVQDVAIAEAARRESVWCEDGTLGERVHAPGRVTLDAADVVAPVIGGSHAQAQRRVEQAVRLAAGRAPVPAEVREAPQASGLGGLHQAMAAGQLDGYRAGVVAFELEVAPADVADAIIAALGAHLGDDASSLRRRTRVLLGRISPDLVRERAKQARAATGLRRWVAEPGVDEWHGTFPSEDAATAWAAIDKLAHDLVAAGTCSNVEQARGKALTDLVTGNATVDVQVVLTVPADAAAPDLPAAGTTADSTPAVQHAQVQTSSSEAHDAPTAVADQPRGKPAEGAVATTTSVLDEPQAMAADLPPSATTPATGQPATETLGDSSSTSVTDQARLAPADEPPAAITSANEQPRTPAANSRAQDQDNDLVEVQGARPSEPLLVRRGWLRDHLTRRPRPSRRSAKPPGPSLLPCDPLTGARLDPGDHLSTDSYRPGPKLGALVRARDGRCRFPGCSVAARFCDLDHAKPWPTGPTAAPNLLTLCRRHHRIKQRPGWRVRLAPDGTTTWTDPTGRERTTTPLDALKSLVLTADSLLDAKALPHGPTIPPTPDIVVGRPATPPTADATERPASPPTPENAAATAWSALETHLQLRLEHHPHPHREQHPWLPPTHRRCTSAADLRAGLARHRARATTPDAPPF